MNGVMLTIHAKGNRPTVESVRSRYGLTVAELDENFGVVEIDLDEGLFTILVADSAATKVHSGSGWEVEGPYSNLLIEPFGPPSAVRKCR